MGHYLELSEIQLVPILHRKHAQSKLLQKVSFEQFGFDGISSAGQEVEDVDRADDALVGLGGLGLVVGVDDGEELFEDGEGAVEGGVHDVDLLVLLGEELGEHLPEGGHVDTHGLLLALLLLQLHVQLVLDVLQQTQ